MAELMTAIWAPLTGSTTNWGLRGWSLSKINEDDTFFKYRKGYVEYSNTEFTGDTTDRRASYSYLPGTYPDPYVHVERYNGQTFTVCYQKDADHGGNYRVWFYSIRGSNKISESYLTFRRWQQPGTTATDGSGIGTFYGSGYVVYDGTDYTESLVSSSSGYDVSIEEVINFGSNSTKLNSSNLYNASKSILGMFGIPYQFMPHVDPRIEAPGLTARAVNIGSGEHTLTTSSVNGSSYLTQYEGTGREWGYFIASNMPILFISPGLPNFMTKFSEEDRNTFTNALGNLAGGVVDKLTPDDLVNNSGKYYTFEYKVNEYYTFCNPACRIASGYMGVNDMILDGKVIESINWMDYTMGKLGNAIGQLLQITKYMAIPFYIESDTQISENFSNDVTDSSLAGWVDGFSDLGREAMFLLGYGKTSLGIDQLSIHADSLQMYEGIAGELDDNHMITNIIQSLTSVASGGRLIFPKIWSDSGFSRSYDVTIKLRSPDMDKKSIYLNIIVPYLHLWCLAVPRGAKGNPNGMFSPFLVRAIYKGFFNVDMGIISSMSVTKGDQAQWTPDGIPTAIDVNITITDLYENITMSPSDTLTAFNEDSMANTNMMDYLANLCGINIYEPEITRTFQMMAVNRVLNKAKDIPNNVWASIQNSIANGITNIWRP